MGRTIWNQRSRVTLREAEHDDREAPPEVRERGEASIEEKNFLDDEREKTDLYKYRQIQYQVNWYADRMLH